MIIGICGKASSGKDTVADMIVKNYTFTKLAFADPLKRYCMDLFDFTEEQLWGPSEKRSEPDVRYPKGDGTYLTPREALQKIGTEGARSCYNNVWVEYAVRNSRELLSNPNLEYDRVHGFFEGHHTVHVPGVAISDVRFINEAEGIKGVGGILLKVERDGAGLNGSAAQHRSEMELESIPDAMFTHIMHNNSSLSFLENMVTDMMSLYL